MCGMGVEVISDEGLSTTGMVGFIGCSGFLKSFGKGSSYYGYFLLLPVNSELCYFGYSVKNTAPD